MLESPLREGVNVFYSNARNMSYISESTFIEGDEGYVLTLGPLGNTKQKLYEPLPLQSDCIHNAGELI